jgi:hypothetical protein
MHCPSLPGTAQDLQRPAQASLQQTPCWQIPELQSSGPPHFPPNDRLPQILLLHEFGAVHSASTEQVSRHFPSVPHMKGSQGCPVVGMQAPVVLQRKANVIVAPTHDGCLHTKPTGYFRQAPAPSQAPSLPHEAIPSSSHSFRGSLPTSAGRQVPRLPCAAQV